MIYPLSNQYYSINKNPFYHKLPLIKKELRKLSSIDYPPKNGQ